MTPSGILKSKSSSKEDLNAIVMDRRVGDDLLLKYSIKSSLGSPATILNASNHTNFIYEVTGLDISDISKINNIKSRTKLIDRLHMIKSLGGQIKFHKMECENFDYNLKLIDSNMPKYLGDVLLDSYEYENKNLKDLFLKNSNFQRRLSAIIYEAGSIGSIDDIHRAFAEDAGTMFKTVFEWKL